MDNINPKEDIKNIKKYLSEFQTSAANALGKVQDQIEIADAISPYWESFNPTQSHGEMFGSAVATLHSWEEQSQGLLRHFQSFEPQIMFTSTGAYNTAAITGTLSQLEHGTSLESEAIAKVVTRHVRRDETIEALRKNRYRTR